MGPFWGSRFAGIGPGSGGKNRAEEAIPESANRPGEKGNEEKSRRQGFSGVCSVEFFQFVLK